MQHLDLESCQLYKDLGGPQDQWPQRIYFLNATTVDGIEAWGCSYGQFHYALPQVWLACPDPMTVLEFLHEMVIVHLVMGPKRPCGMYVYTIDHKPLFIQDYGSPLDAVAALLKAVADREGVTLDA